mmetsp:Transcript_25658/g.82612  ORF Transcript_25658/g.82612 Transcript_25658/m.82612 type:complete len:269 (-) Transcript_25658:251-1057(-)
MSTSTTPRLHTSAANASYVTRSARMNGPTPGAADPRLDDCSCDTSGGMYMRVPTYVVARCETPTKRAVSKSASTSRAPWRWCGLPTQSTFSSLMSLWHSPAACIAARPWASLKKGARASSSVNGRSAIQSNRSDALASSSSRKVPSLVKCAECSRRMLGCVICFCISTSCLSDWDRLDVGADGPARSDSRPSASVTTTVLSALRSSMILSARISSVCTVIARHTLPLAPSPSFSESFTLTYARCGRRLTSANEMSSYSCNMPPPAASS